MGAGKSSIGILEAKQPRRSASPGKRETRAASLGRQLSGPLPADAGKGPLGTSGSAGDPRLPPLGAPQNRGALGRPSRSVSFKGEAELYEVTPRKDDNGFDLGSVLSPKRSAGADAEGFDGDLLRELEEIIAMPGGSHSVQVRMHSLSTQIEINKSVPEAGGKRRGTDNHRPSSERSLALQPALTPASKASGDSPRKLPAISAAGGSERLARLFPDRFGASAGSRAPDGPKGSSQPSGGAGSWHSSRLQGVLRSSSPDTPAAKPDGSAPLSFAPKSAALAASLSSTAAAQAPTDHDAASANISLQPSRDPSFWQQPVTLSTISAVQPPLSSLSTPNGPPSDASERRVVPIGVGGRTISIPKLEFGMSMKIVQAARGFGAPDATPSSAPLAGAAGADDLSTRSSATSSSDDSDDLEERQKAISRETADRVADLFDFEQAVLADISNDLSSIAKAAAVGNLAEPHWMARQRLQQRLAESRSVARNVFAANAASMMNAVGAAGGPGAAPAVAKKVAPQRSSIKVAPLSFPDAGDALPSVSAGGQVWVPPSQPSQRTLSARTLS